MEKKKKKNTYESAVTEVFESFLKSQSAPCKNCLNSCFERTKLKHLLSKSSYKSSAVRFVCSRVVISRARHIWMSIFILYFKENIYGFLTFKIMQLISADTKLFFNIFQNFFRPWKYNKIASTYSPGWNF